MYRGDRQRMCNGWVTSPLSWNLLLIVLDYAINQGDCILSKVTGKCEITELQIKLDKTELVVFTKKHKLGNFKCLCIVLDRKLNWK